ncbi:MAG TPA: signal peptidase II [Pirellulales bacterium]|jgi:signal peptidase II|nr:signal peptidase II [Pirellulales bacterium]
MRAVPINRYAIFLLIGGLGCLADLATKHWVFAALGAPGGEAWWLCEDYCGFQTSLNEGALFGMGQGMVWLFAALSIAAAFAIVYWLFIAGAARDLLLTVALGCVMGGILGNLYDRLGLWTLAELPGKRIYAVRDWILFQYHGWVWPNFNLADSLLVCGAALLVWHTYRSEARQVAADTHPASSR